MQNRLRWHLRELFPELNVASRGPSRLDFACVMPESDPDSRRKRRVGRAYQGWFEAK